MKIENEKRIDDFKKTWHLHPDTDTTVGFYISAIYAFILFSSNLKLLLNNNLPWVIYLVFFIFFLSTLGSTTLLIGLFSLLLKGYGCIRKPGYRLFYRLGDIYIPMGGYRIDLGCFSKKASLFGKFRLLIMILAYLVLTFTISAMLINFEKIFLGP